jgi:endoglycosylceramidase
MRSLHFRRAERASRFAVLASPRGFRRAVLAALAVLAAALPAAAALPDMSQPVAPLSHRGRWFTDALGRVVLLRGVNFVEKSPPFHPAGVGFDDDDGDFLVEHGFNVVRLGVVFEALMPEPGVLALDYVESLAESVEMLSARGTFVVVDFHQDGWGPATHGNGMPAWSTITDGLPNPNEPFPIYYVTNPALQRAFENFWANRTGPDGVPLQTHYAAAARALSERFADEPFVIGHEAMNEPWPGADWADCVAGCPEKEKERLVPFYRRFSKAVRQGDRDGFVFVEPFVLFNFGRGDTSLPGIGRPRNALSFHVYGTTPEEDLSVMDRAIAASEQNSDALLATEWGATNDPARIRRITGQFDSRLLSWTFWAYNENVIRQTEEPPEGANLRPDVVSSLTRPYPVATNGTPLELSFDPTTRVLEYRWSTRRPNGRRGRAEIETSVVLPASIYPAGVTVDVQGGTVVSQPGALYLRVRNLPDAGAVRLTVSPAS